MPTLYVTLDTTKTPWAVSVNQSNGLNEIPQSGVVQTITWQLTGNAASGTFNSLTDPNNPGFSWLGTQPARGIFTSPAVNGNQFTLNDLNNSANTTGTWTYKLCINVGGTVYTTATDGIRGTDTTPSVKNK